jgi:hypothetical protein
MLNERKLTPSELKKRDEIVSNMIKNKKNLVNRYGKDAEKVVYGRATNIIKNKTEEEINKLLKPKDSKSDNDVLNEINNIMEKMTPTQLKKRGEIYDALKAQGMSDEKAGRIATAKAMRFKKKKSK